MNFINQRNIFFLAMFFFWALLLSLSASSRSLIIDDFIYASIEEAREVWSEGGGSPPLEIGGEEDEAYIEAPINFQPGQSRHYWDGLLEPDLSDYDRIILDLEIPHFGFISTFTLYFHCSATNSWAFSNREITQTGRQEWTFYKEDFSYHSEDFDWSHIDRIRFSPWKLQEGVSYIRFHHFYAYPPDIYIVRNTRSQNQDIVGQTTSLLSTLFSNLDIYTSEISDTDVENGMLEGSKIAVYPYNNEISEEETEKIEEFVQAGGKLMVFYPVIDPVADLLGMTNHGWQALDTKGYVFNAPHVPGLPESVIQNSWNIFHVTPEREDARILAYWKDSTGEITEYPAWILSDTGAYMSHIALDDDREQKGKALFAITGALYPQIWEEKVEEVFNNIGKIAHYNDYSEARDDIEKLADHSPHKRDVLDFLEQAESYFLTANNYRDDGQYPAAIQKAGKAGKALMNAYARVQSGKRGEFRAIWESAGTGIKPGNWEYSIHHLHESGFHAIIPIMAWGATAHYDSDYLLPSQAFIEHGDQITQLVEAARNYGFKVHPRKILWWDRNAPQDWLDTMSAEGRLQKSIQGEESHWLCPSHPDNRALEINSYLEMVQNYDIDGIHMDYIRYENRHYCYCDGCRERFEKEYDLTVQNWPHDCYSGPLQETYREWRINIITSLVQTIAEEARNIDPDILISAAVFSNYESAVENVGQDWITWCKEGYLDFVCPMNYTTNIHTFNSHINTQKKLLDDSVPLYSGIKGYDIQADQVILQILSLREHDLDGFVLFNYAPYAVENILPFLEMGITKDPVSNVKDFRFFE